MPSDASLRRLGGGRWETRDGRFAIEPQSGTWVIVDNEQTDELGLPLVRGPFGSLTAAKEAIVAVRTEGPKASPLAKRIEQARGDQAARSRMVGAGAAEALQGVAEPALPGEAEQPPKPSLAAAPAEEGGRAGRAGRAGPVEPAGSVAPGPPPEPRWLRDLEPRERRRARDLIARLERMGVGDPERVVRAEMTAERPALARLAIERALARVMVDVDDPRTAARRAVRAILRGADVELGVGWKLVDDQGRPIEKVDIPR